MHFEFYFVAKQETILPNIMQSTMFFMIQSIDLLFREQFAKK